jgi:SAM-dependent methyltransferase
MQNFYVLGKTDGIRTIIVIESNVMYFLNGNIRSIQLKSSHKNKTVCDVEHVIEKNANGESIDHYYIFDVLSYMGNSLTLTPTENRVSYINKIIDMSEGHIKVKSMVSLTSNYKSEISDLWQKEQSHGLYEVDGLVFTPKDGMYRSMRSWKWKPLSHMSIDFLLKKSPSSLNGIYPYNVIEGYTLMLLFSGINKSLFDKLKLQQLPKYKELFPGMKLYHNFPIQFSPSNEPFAYLYYHPDDSNFSVDEISNNVCEFRRIDTKDNLDNPSNRGFKWDIMRIRTDRKTELVRGNYFGNNFYIAEYTWQNYENPLTFDDLIISSSEYMDRGYFQEEKSEMYRSMTAYNSYIKGQLLKPYHKSDWIVDLAAGKGQDMFRVSNAEIKNALFIDSDAQALSELISRKHDFERGISKLNTRIYTKLIDLKSDHDKILSQLKSMSIPIGGIDVIMCNFAIHYLLSTPDNLRNLIKLISNLLKPGGHFFFTSFNGDTVFKTLGKNDSWDIREGEVLKYSIKKKFTSNKLEPTGQLIDVLLPFSKGKYYEEYLVNYEYIIKEFKLNGFDFNSKGDFGEYMTGFTNDVKKHASNLSENDKQFLQLYGYVVLQKKHKSGGTSSSKLVKDCKIEIANKYPDKKIFVSKFKDVRGKEPIEIVNDITECLPYNDKSEIIKSSVHIGQRKLFLSEMQFLTKHNKGICIYAGSSPSNKTHYLSTLFPDIKFVLIDPNKFDIKLPNNKSHRQEPHKDIIHIYSHFETNSNTYDKFNNKRMSDLDDDQYKSIIEFIKDSDYKIYIIEDYMNIRDAGIFKTFEDFVFISDIRSNSSKDGYPLDSDIYWNMSMMYNWIVAMSPIESMLKHRMPYSNGNNEDILNPLYEDDFKLSKQYGIDFKNDYIEGVSRMSKSVLYIQAWAGISSTEVRMHIKRDDINTIITYDIKDIECKFNYYNSINRPWLFHNNNNSDKLIGFCHCGDCSLENKIISDYLEKMKSELNVKDVVQYLGKVTNRPLINIHKFNIWENLLNNPQKFKEAISYVKSSIINNTKKPEYKTLYKKHRGDKGKE